MCMKDNTEFTDGGWIKNGPWSLILSRGEAYLKCVITFYISHFIVFSFHKHLFLPSFLNTL